MIIPTIEELVVQFHLNLKCELFYDARYLVLIVGNLLASKGAAFFNNKALGL